MAAVTLQDSSDERHRATLASSSASPMRPGGIVVTISVFNKAMTAASGAQDGQVS